MARYQKLAITQQNSPRLTIVDGDTFATSAPSTIPAGDAQAVAWSHDAALVAVAHSTSPRVTIYNADGLTKLTNPGTLPTGNATGVAFSPDDALLAVSHGTSPYVTIYNTADWSKVTDPLATLPYNGRKCAFSPDGSKLLASHYPRSNPADQGYIVYNTADWSEIIGLPQIPAYYGIGVAWADDTFFAVAWAATPYGYLVDVGTKLTVEQFDSYISEPARGVAFVPLEEPPGPDPGVDIDTPVEITVTSAAQTIDTPVRVQVAEVQNIDTATRITVVSASVLAGLNGAGGWPAAPDGKWQAVAFIGNTDFSARLSGVVRVTRAVDEAATAEFSILPAAALEPMALIRQPVRLTFAQAGGLNAQLMFMGAIDVAEIDLTQGVIRCRCTDQLQEVIANTPREWIDANVGGRFSGFVSGTPVDNWQYLEARIKSVPKSIALDVMQRPVVLPWRTMPRSATIRINDTTNSSLSIDLPSSTQIRTRITVRLQYRYTRLRARGAIAQWSQPFSFFAAYDNVTGLRVRSWLLTSMIEGATARLSGWERVGNTLVHHPEVKTYFPNPPTFGGYIIGPDVAPALASGFSAKYRTRWTQTVTESYAVTLRLPGVETLIGGQISDEIGANMTASPAPDRWAMDYTALPEVAPPMIGDALEPWQPEGEDTDARDNALLTLLDQAWVRLWESSRTGRVRCALPLRPDMWFDVAATIDSAAINATGPVVEVEHSMSVETGRAVTSLAVAVGLPGNADAAMPSFTVPALAAEDLARPLSAYSAEIGTYVGGEPESPPFDAETMIGFCTNRTRSGAEGEDTWNYYPHQLSIRAPSIDEIDRDPVTLTAETTIDVQIPTDLLEMTP